MRHFAKLFSCPATMLSSSLVLSSLNGETIRRLGSKRYYLEEPNKSLTLRERGLPTMAARIWVWHQDLQQWRSTAWV